VGYLYMPFCHHLHQVSVAELVGYIPANTKRDDLMIKVATFE